MGLQMSVFIADWNWQSRFTHLKYVVTWLTTALSNKSLIFSSESPDTPETISVAAIFIKDIPSSYKQSFIFIK